MNTVVAAKFIAGKMATDRDRRPRINKGFLLEILQHIGAQSKPSAFLPKKKKVAPKVKESKHHLTSGKSVDHKLVKAIEENSKLAFRIPEDGQKVMGPKRIRKSFHTYRSRLETHKLERLFIPKRIKRSDDSGDETDPEFNRIVNGRPMKHQGTLREHSWAVQNCFLTKLRSGDLELQGKVMEKARAEEAKLLEKTEHALQEQLEGFNRFLREDHADSVQWLAQADAAVAETNKLEAKMCQLRKELKATETRVQLLEDRWQSGRLLQQFLDMVAPPSWRKTQPETMLQEDGDENLILRSSDDSSEPEIADLKTRVDRFLKETTNTPTPHLYFENPEQLFTIFRTLEISYLGSLLQCEKLKPAVTTMSSTLDESTLLFLKEREDSSDDVIDLGGMVQCDRDEAGEIQSSVTKICDKHLYPLLNDPRSVDIAACVEDAFERVIGPNDSDLDALAMIKAIETKHESLVVGLDVLPPDIVSKTKYAWEKEERRVLATANDAAKKVHQMEMLTKKFTNALKTWSGVPTRRLVKRSEPPKEKIRKERQLKVLTSSEEEHQYFFQELKQEDMYRPRF